MRLIVRVAGAATAAVLLVATWPQPLELHRVHVFAQLTALRGLLVVAGVVFALLFLVVARPARARGRFTAGIVALLLAVAGLNAGLMVARGLAVGGDAGSGRSDVTVFAWNTLGDAPGAELIAAFAVQHGVDVLALAETSRGAAEEIARLMHEAGHEMQMFALSSPNDVVAQSTALLVANSMGEYAIDLTVGSTPRVVSVVARPVGGTGPTLVSAHTVPPLPTSMHLWEGGLRWLAERCREANVIVAGDFNATLDHFAGLRDEGADLGGCNDAAHVAGSAALGTWPSRVPMLLGSPIDHVMATHEWEVTAFRIVAELDGEGSDHRALLASLQRVR